VEYSFTTLFKKPSARQPVEPREQLKPRRGYDVPKIFLPIYLPLLFIAWAVSIPWSSLRRVVVRRRERRFSQQMSAAGRTMAWEDFEGALNEKRGTAVGEYLSLKGPFRLWWTPDDIPLLSPHKCDRGNHYAWLEHEFMPFFDWCRKQYTDPQTGTASLVIVPREEGVHLKDRLNDARFVSIYSSERRSRNLATPPSPD
jgi:hypothetical protein